MTQVVGKVRPSAPPAWQFLYEPIQPELAAAEDLLRRELRSEDPFVDRLAKHAFRLGGKRLRPALLLLSGKASGRLLPAHQVLAAVVEMIHTATLVHDDVLDEAEIRRHSDTLNARYGNEASVLVGDYLFTHAFYLASTLENTYACRMIGEATNTVCAGELRQLATRGNFALSEADHLAILDAKTAELCACCCRLGAHYAEASPEVCEELATYGREVGLAFQITDDLLDLVGDEQVAGKSLGTDLAKHRPTLPLIRCLELATDAERRELLALLDRPAAEGRAELRPWFERYGALAYAREVARQFAQRAADRLRILSPSPAREALARVAVLLVDRAQ
jgi:octaprenyl-diphosphate synthase